MKTLHVARECACPGWMNRSTACLAVTIESVNMSSSVTTLQTAMQIANSSVSAERTLPATQADASVLLPAYSMMNEAVA
jgi:hypothetical protein